MLTSNRRVVGKVFWMKCAGLTLLRWSAEAHHELQGAPCRRVLAFPGRSALVLHFRGRRDRYLVLPSGGNLQAVCWLEGKPQLVALGDQQATEMFNRLPGRLLEAVRGKIGDRRIEFLFAPRIDHPPEDRLSLFAHLMGARPLCILCDHQRKILQTDRRVERYAAGEVYHPPSPPRLIDPLSLVFPTFLRLWRTAAEPSLREFLTERLWGIDEELAELFVPEKHNLAAKSTDRQAWAAFAELKNSFRFFLSRQIPLRTATDTGRICGWAGDTENAAGQSLNNILAGRMLARLEQDQQDNVRDRWSKFATGQQKKICKAQQAQAKRRQEAARAEEFKQIADLLNMHRHLLRRGQQEVELPNVFCDHQQITIQLDPAKTVQGNIEYYYKKHRRALATQENIGDEQIRLNKAAQLLQEIAQFMAETETEPDSSHQTKWREELDKLRLPAPREKPATSRKTPERRRPYRSFDLEDGAVVWVGKAAKDNDELTTRLAAKTDWFLHARLGSGAHVILKHDQSTTPPSRKSLEQAAGVAAFFSEAKHSAIVPVSYTPIKYVRKPRKAAPGLVTLLQEETLMVAPQPPPGYHQR